MSNPDKGGKSMMNDHEIIQIIKASLNGVEIERRSLLPSDEPVWVKPALTRLKRYKPKASSEVDAIAFNEFVVFGGRVTINQLDENGRPRSFFFFGHSVELLDDTLSYIIDRNKGTSLLFTPFDMLIVRADNSLTVLPREDFFRSYTEIEK